MSPRVPSTSLSEALVDSRPRSEGQTSPGRSALWVGAVGLACLLVGGGCAGGQPSPLQAKAPKGQASQLQPNPGALGDPAASRGYGPNHSILPATWLDESGAGEIATSWRLAAEAWDTIPAPEQPSASEWDLIAQGWTVARPLDFELDGRSYVGGAAYQLIAAGQHRILTTLTDPEQLRSALPLTHDAKQVAQADGRLLPSPATAPSSSAGANRRPERLAGGAPWVAVELLQGNALLRAKYTVTLARPDAHTIKFTLDPTRKHNIRDARGFFTAHQVSPTHSLVTAFVGVDLGSGLVSALLRGAVQKATLSAPAHIRKYVEPIAKRERVARAAAEQEQRLRQLHEVATRR